MGILKRSSYYTPDYTQSAALIRARRPYLFRNAITGICIMSFAVGVFTFTLRAVGQEKFDDVIVPDGPKEEVSVRSKIPTARDLQRNKDVAGEPAEAAVGGAVVEGGVLYGKKA